MNYQGSKKRYAKHIINEILKDSNIDPNQPIYWLEPFVGGLNVAPELKKIFTRAHLCLNDIKSDLMDLYIDIFNTKKTFNNWLADILISSGFTLEQTTYIVFDIINKNYENVPETIMSNEDFTKIIKSIKGKNKFLLISLFHLMGFNFYHERRRQCHTILSGKYSPKVYITKKLRPMLCSMNETFNFIKDKNNTFLFTTCDYQKFIELFGNNNNVYDPPTIIYLDPPYMKTQGYDGTKEITNFNSEEFINFLINFKKSCGPNIKIYISESHAFYEKFKDNLVVLWQKNHNIKNNIFKSQRTEYLFKLKD